MKKILCLFLALLMAASLFAPLTGCQGSEAASVQMVEHTVPMDDMPDDMQEAETEAPAPTEVPAAEPTAAPAAEPTAAPAAEPTAAPVAEPTEAPVVEATKEPVAEVTAEPTEEPADEPTEKSSDSPAVISEPEMDNEVASVPGPSDEPEATEVPEKVTVKLNPDGGTFPVEIDQIRGYIEVDLAEGRELTFKDAANRAPKREGYTFEGWFTAKGESGTKVEIGSKVPDEAKELFAHWKAEVRTVSLHVVNGSLSGNWGEKDISAESSVDVTLEGNVLPSSVSSLSAVRPNGTFKGWYTKAPTEEQKTENDYNYWTTVSVNGEKVEPGKAVPAGVTVLYAAFDDAEQVKEEDKRVTFYLDWNGIDGMWGHCLTLTRSYQGEGGYKVAAGDLAVWSLNWNGEKESKFETQEDLTTYWNGKDFNGYTFKGWATSPEMTVPDVVAGTTVVANGASLYAVWTKGDESSDKFERVDPAAGLLEFTQLLGQLDSSKSGSVHGSKGASFSLDLHCSPVRATVDEITWHIYAKEAPAGGDASAVLTAESDSADLTITSSESEKSVDLFDGKLKATATGRSLVITAVEGGSYGVTVSADAASTYGDDSVTIHTNADAKISFVHSWGPGQVTKTAATCGDTTDTTYSCTVCDVTYTQSVKKNHLYSSKEVTLEPTCTTAGRQTWICQYCGDQGGSSSIPALGHDWQLDPEKPAEIVDCRHTKYYDKCAREDCEETRERTEYAYNTEGHNWGDWYTLWDADYLRTGMEERYCPICRGHEDRTIPIKPVIELAYSGFRSMGSAKNQIVNVSGANYCADGSGYAVTGWQTVNNKNYYFNPSDGIMATGWQTISGKKYYMGSDGLALTGMQTVGGKKYCFGSDGAVLTGMQTVSGKKYYFGSDGAMTTGMQTVSGKKYYFGSDGVMTTGWQTVSGKKYYMGADGIMKTGWQSVSGKKYYLGTDGVMKTGWQTVSGKKYYFDGNGVMASGGVKISGKSYVFNSDGSQVTGSGWKTIGGRKYYLNSDGSAKTGWQTISKKKYYFDPTTGAMATGSVNISGKTYLFKNDGTQVTGKGWKTVSGKKYYFNSNGSVKTGLVTISGKKYYFNANGQMLKGWQTINGKRYYFGSNGAAYKGWKTISGKKYYFNSDGSVKTGLVTISGKKYYFNSNGQMLKGWQTINGKRYYFNSNGAAAKGWKTISGKKYYFKSNCQMATGKLKIGGKTYTFDSNGVMKK